MHRYVALRERELRAHRWRFLVQQGEGAFASAQAAGALTALICLEQLRLEEPNAYFVVDVAGEQGPSNLEVDEGGTPGWRA